MHAGELVTLLGSNGAGKSTTLRAISQLMPIAAGRVCWRLLAINGLRTETTVRLGIAHCPERRRVLASQSVADNLELGAWLRRDRAGIRADLERCFDLFPRLAERRQQAAGSLSGGEQQMLAIARALMASPTLLMLDEPSLGLAPRLVEEIDGGPGLAASRWPHDPAGGAERSRRPGDRRSRLRARGRPPQPRGQRRGAAGEPEPGGGLSGQ